MEPLPHLGQQQRLRSLKIARAILICVGVVTVALNGYFLWSAEDELGRDEGRASGGGAPMAGELASEQSRMQAKFSCRAGVVLGAIFVVLGALVTSFPLPCTVGGLVLYLGVEAAIAIASPGTLLDGIIIKVLIVVCLVKSLQAAIAYQRQQLPARLRYGN